MWKFIDKWIHRQNQKPKEIVIPFTGYPWYPFTFINQELLYLKERGFNVRILVYNKRGEEELHDEFKSLLECIEEITTKDVEEHKKAFRYFCERYPERVNYIGTRLKPYLGGKRIEEEPYLLPAFGMARDLLERPVGYLHSHFTYQASTWTYMISRLLDVPYGLTTHADSFVESPYKLLKEHVTDAAFVIAISQQARENVLNLCGQEFANKVIVKRNGIDLQKFRNNHLPSEHRLISVSRLDPKKGLIYLVEACNILIQRGYKLTCNIFGSANDEREKEVEQTLKERIDRYDVGEYVKMRGFATRERLMDYFKNATIFIAPYIVRDNGERDGIPTSLLEAMAMSVVPIATDAGAIPELIDDGINGLLVSQRDPEAIANAIEKLLNDRDYFLRLRSRVRSKIEKEYNTEVVNRILEEKIREHMK